MTRPTCPRCLRPQSTCLCDLVSHVDNATEVLILQHPLEQYQAKGSASLLQLCLNHCHLQVGEKVDIAQLLTDDKRNILLYPADENSTTQAVTDLTPSDTRLIVLDGTWRKSRKLLHLNPELATLPRLNLTDLPASRYQIRKAHHPDQLSTLEATCLALGQIDQSPDNYTPILEAFEQFIDRLKGFIPHQ